MFSRYPVKLRMRSSILGPRRNLIASFTTACCLLGYLASVIFADIITIRHLLPDLLSAYLLAWAAYGLLSTVSRAELMIRFLLTTCSVAGCLIAAEAPALLRIVDYRAIFGSYESGNALSVLGRHADPELLWRHDAYYAYDEPYQGNLGLALCVPPDSARSVTVQYDRHGFRNREDLEKADIVVLGDSYIEGYMTPEPLLATSLLSRFQDRIVANLGHSGYGPQQELVVLQRYGLSLHPQTVIWAFFEGNDFSDLEQYDVQRAQSGWPLWQDLWYRSLTRNALARMLRPARPCTPSPKIVQSQARFRDDRNHISQVFFAPSEVQRVSAETLTRAMQYIVEAAQLCRERDIRFIVMFIPEKYRVYHSLSNVELTSDTIRSWPVSSLPDEIGRHLTELGLGIEYIDLTPALKELSRTGRATYLPDDTHWTEAGNQLVAEILDRALRVPPQISPTLQAWSAAGVPDQ